MGQIKKVLYVCSVYKPNIGGIETTIEELIKNLRAKDIETVVLTKKYPFDLPEKDFFDKTLVLRMSRPRSDSEYIESIKFIKKYSNLLKADIVHLIGVRRPMPLYGLLLSKFWKVPYIVTFTGGDVPDSNELDSITIWIEGKDIVPQSILQADKLTTFSKYTGSLAKLAINKLSGIDVIYAGVDIDEIKRTPEHKEKFEYFFSARRLDSSKGIDILIQAYSMIKEKLINTKLLIAGDGSEAQLLRKLVNKLRLQNDVIFLGALEHSEVISYMKGAIAHICPSRTEGGGIVNYEAQASGCLAIGSNAGGIPEYIKSNRTGLIFPVGDPKALADLLLFSVENKKQTGRLKRFGKTEVSEKTWENFSSKYLEVYNGLSENYEYKSFKSWSNITEKMWEDLKK